MGSVNRETDIICSPPFRSAGVAGIGLCAEGATREQRRQSNYRSAPRGYLKAAMFRAAHCAKVRGGRPRTCSASGLTTCSAADGSPRMARAPSAMGSCMNGSSCARASPRLCSTNRTGVPSAAPIA